MNILYVWGAIITGGFLGHLLKIPAGVLVGGLIAGLGMKIFLGGDSHSFKALAVISQLLVAGVIVLQSDMSSVRMLPRMVPVAFVYSLLMLIFSLMMAWIIVKFCHIDPVTALFATPPGGLTGLGLAATQSSANAPMALLFHVIRITTILIAVPLIALLFRR